MHEVFQVWRNTRMIVLTAISAAAYVAVLVPFKGFVLIPGLTELRPGAAIPVVLSFLFGPAAAWGAAFGNLIADALGGMLGPGSLPGMVGNFIYGYLPYALWRAFMGQSHPLRSGIGGWLIFGIALVTACLAIGSVIGWGVDLLKLAPFAALGLIIAVNNAIACAAIATPLLALLYSRVQNWGLLYFQILDEEIPGQPPQFPRKRAIAGALLCIVGAAAAFIPGLFISAGLSDTGFGAAAFAGTKGTLSVALGMSPGLLLLLLGLLLL